MIRYNAQNYGYVYNLLGDVIAIIDSAGTKVVEYKYDAWGKILSKTGSMASTLGTYNPFRYRHYVYDEETGLYYLQTRYYSPATERFINADGIAGVTGVLLSHNGYAYCSNNPIRRKDIGGAFFFDIIVDVVSLAISVVDVVKNPTDPMAWVGLAGDVVDLIPGVTGVGEAVRAVNTGIKAADAVDNIVDGLKIADNAADVAKGWHVGDDIAMLTRVGNDPAWSTVRSRFWKNEEYFYGAGYSAANRELMKRGKAPLVKYSENGKWYSMELYHKIPKHKGGLNTYDNLEALSPWKHAEKDRFRHFVP